MQTKVSGSGSGLIQRLCTVKHMRHFAALGYSPNKKWNIVLTGLKYVNATVQVVGSTPTCTVADYNNGTIVVNAQVIGNNPPMLGDIVHLQAAVGNFVAAVQLKN
jgi:hypothetical protein